MLFTRTTFIGIDVTAGRRAIAYAALDNLRRPIALGQGNLVDVLAFVGGQHSAVVAVNAPPRPNQGALAKLNEAKRLSPSPKGKADYRLAEYKLECRNLNIHHTPSSDADCKNWMRVGFEFYKRLRELGFEHYPSQECERQLLEVWTPASYHVWLGRAPLPKNSLDGKLQRQLLLYEMGLDTKDPMRFFEEVTRHRLLRGELPLGELYSASELESMAAAYLAWSAATHPEDIELLGDQDEGQIVVPIRQFI